MIKKEKVFLSIILATYKRPEKIMRLLKIFKDKRWNVLFDYGIEIIICDDSSNDGTEEIIKRIIPDLKKAGWKVRYICRKRNLKNDENIYLGYSKDANGDYAWLLCDDDIVLIDESIDFINNIYNKKPTIAICGFKQGIDNMVSNTGISQNNSLFTNFDESLSAILHFTKTSAYVMKVHRDESIDNFFYSHLNGTLYSWIGICIIIINLDLKQGLYFHRNICVTGDDDYGGLRYSFRVFKNLSKVKNQTLKFIGKKANYTKEDDELMLCIKGIKCHYSFASEPYYVKKILTQEISYLKKNIFLIFLSLSKFFEFLKLLYYLLIDKIFKFKDRKRYVRF